MTLFGFAGTSAFGADALRALHGAGVPLALVLTQPDRPAGRRRVPTAPPVAVAARALGLPLEQPERVDDALAAVRAAGVVAMALVAYGQLVRAPLLEAVPWLNLHPSILPRWRGAAPIERAMMAGDDETGVAVMRLVAALDAGPVSFQARFAIDPADDAGDVAARALALGVPALADALRAAAAGTLVVAAQDAGGVSYADKLGPADRTLDPAAETVRSALDRVRALRPAPGAVLALGGQRIGVWRASAASGALAPEDVEVVDGVLRVGFADGVVALDELQAPGRGRLDAAAFLRGWRGPLDTARRAA